MSLRILYADGRTANLNHRAPRPTLTADVVELHGWWIKDAQGILKEAAQNCPNLRVIRWYTCPKLKSVAFTFPELRILSLRACKDLRTIDGLVAPRLEELCLGSGTAVSKTRIPEHFHPIVTPRSLVVRGKSRPKPTQRKGADGKRIRLIREMLRDWDHERVDQGAELAIALQDDEVFTGLLEKTTLEEKELRKCCPGMESYAASRLGIRGLKAHRLHHNGFFHTSPGRRGVRDFAVTRLFEGWEDQTMLDFSGITSWVAVTKTGGVLDLSHLPRLMPNLETLCLWDRPNEVRGWEALHELPKLRRLIAYQIPVKVPPQVTTLHTDVGGGEGLHHIQWLFFGGYGAIAPVARQVPNVREMTLRPGWRTPPEEWKAIAQLKHLKTLTADSYGTLEGVKHLRASPSLEEIRLNFTLRHPKKELPLLCQLPTLKRLKVQSKQRSAVPKDKRHLLI